MVSDDAVKLLTGVIAGVATLGVALWALYKPAQPLILAVFLLPLDKVTVLFPPQSSRAKDLTLLSTLTVAKMVLFVIFVSWAVRTIVARDDIPIRIFRESIMPALVVAFWFFSFITMVTARQVGLFIFFELRMIYQSILYFFLVVALVRDREVLRKIIVAFFCSEVIVGLMAVYEVFTGEHVQELLGLPVKAAPYVEVEEKYRPLATLGDPNYLGIHLVVASAIAVFLAMRHPSRLLRVMAVLALPLFFFGVVGTGSRAALIAYLAMMGIILIACPLRHRLLLAGGGAASMGVLLLLYSLAISDTPLDRFSGEESMKGVLTRWGTTLMSFDMIADNPVLGVGMGNYVSAYHQFLNPTVPRDPIWPYNDFLLVWAELGILGIFFYGLLYVVSSLYAVRAAMRATDLSVPVFSITMLASLVGMILFAGSHNVQGVQELYWITFALATIAWKVSGEPAEEAVRP